MSGQHHTTAPVMAPVTAPVTGHVTEQATGRCTGAEANSATRFSTSTPVIALAVRKDPAFDDDAEVLPRLDLVAAAQIHSTCQESRELVGPPARATDAITAPTTSLSTPPMGTPMAAVNDGRRHGLMAERSRCLARPLGSAVGPILIVMLTAVSLVVAGCRNPEPPSDPAVHPARPIGSIGSGLSHLTPVDSPDKRHPR